MKICFTIQDFTMHCWPYSQSVRCYECSNLTWWVFPTHENASQPFLMTITVPLISLLIKLLCFSLGNTQSLWPPTWAVCSYFHSPFYSHTSCDLSDCAVSSTHGRFCFHHSKNNKLHALSSPSAIKLTLWCTFGGIRVSLSEWPALVACSNSYSEWPAPIHSRQT